MYIIFLTFTSALTILIQDSSSRLWLHALGVDTHACWVFHLQDCYICSGNSRVYSCSWKAWSLNSVLVNRKQSFLTCGKIGHPDTKVPEIILLFSTIVYVYLNYIFWKIILAGLQPKHVILTIKDVRNHVLAALSKVYDRRLEGADTYSIQLHCFLLLTVVMYCFKCTRCWCMWFWSLKHSKDLYSWRPWSTLL